ncbi:MAG: ABC transporter ATP-binding protein [Clostridiales bacterium]|jgi:peptide/nickel transport system ATP-binding protein/oligopeptide transport system ATP-binding protein|nr:ABC transporter ATP-binding protein [Clostridiales bacterium]
MADSGEDLLIRFEELTKTFKVSSRGFGSERITAVDHVSFSIRRGETFGLVGESGCGKSTFSKIALRLVEATSGSVFYEGRDIYKMPFRQLREIRRDMQVVFQDPYDSLNPRLTLEELAAEPLRVHKQGGKAARRERVESLFNDVGLPTSIMGRYPHQLSGGQRQRLCIARTLALSPKFIILDEAVSALDVSIQAQILNLLQDLKKQFNLTYLFISHNLSVVKFASDRIGVMYFGRIIEIAEKRELFSNVLHPYTYALLSAIPGAGLEAEKRRALMQAGAPSIFNAPKGCAFSSRCPWSKDMCGKEPPTLKDMGGGHCAACHFAGELELNLGL